MLRTNHPELRTTVFEILEHRGISPSRFAERCGISYNYLAKIRSGEKPIPQRFVDAAQEILDLPYSTLFFASSSYDKDEMSVADDSDSTESDPAA